MPLALRAALVVVGIAAMASPLALMYPGMPGWYALALLGLQLFGGACALVATTARD